MARKGSVEMEGPFFRHDPAKTFRQNIRVLMDQLAAEGETGVRAALRGGESGRAPVRGTGGRVADDVVGRTKSLRGKRWAVTAVVSAHRPGLSKAQAISLRAAASRLESKGRPFRKTRYRMNRLRKSSVDALLKGIA